jgi:hypothetical protein
MRFFPLMFSLFMFILVARVTRTEGTVSSA